jgi:FKBP-type peptidyl-prolyl cis-trans isomerase FkpA
MKRALPLVLIAAGSLAGLATAADAPKAATQPAAPGAAKAATADKWHVPATDADKALYAIGQILAGQLRTFSLSPQEALKVRTGFSDALAGGPPGFTPDTYKAQIMALQTERAGKLVAKVKEEGKAARDRAAREPNTETTAQGIVITTLEAGEGATPHADDSVKVHYEGKLINGTVFDSSVQRGQPATFKLANVVPCWTEALQHVHVGGKARIYCPSETAYGDRGAQPMIPGGATLVFEVQLLDVTAGEPAAAAAPAAPAAAAAPGAPAAPAQPTAH